MWPTEQFEFETPDLDGQVLKTLLQLFKVKNIVIQHYTKNEVEKCCERNIINTHENICK